MEQDEQQQVKQDGQSSLHDGLEKIILSLDLDPPSSLPLPQVAGLLASEEPKSSPSNKEQRAEIVNKVRSALQSAKESEQKDQVKSINAAIELYKITIDELDQLLPDIPEELRPDLQDHYDRYAERLDTLKTHQTNHQPPPTRSRPLSRGKFEGAIEELDRATRGEGLGDVRKSWEPEPENSLRRPFWILRLVRATIVSGGFITPICHIPRLVWEQGGARFTSLSTKISCLETLLSLLIDRIRPLDYPENNLQQAQRALQVFVGLRTELNQLQNALARPFSFIKDVPVMKGDGSVIVPTLLSSKTATSRSSADIGSAKAGTGVVSEPGGVVNMQQRLNNMVFAIGKTVKKSAVSVTTAYERIGAAVPGNISEDELRSYASLIAEVAEKSQILDEWYMYLEGRRKELQERLRQQVLGGDKAAEEVLALYQLFEGMLGEFLHIARFLGESIVELVMRDLHGLLDSYLTKMRKSFARMRWDIEEPPES